jgi:hypothetical protein
VNLNELSGLLHFLIWWDKIKSTSFWLKGSTTRVVNCSGVGFYWCEPESSSEGDRECVSRGMKVQLRAASVCKHLPAKFDWEMRARCCPMCGGLWTQGPHFWGPWRLYNLKLKGFGRKLKGFFFCPLTFRTPLQVHSIYAYIHSVYANIHAYMHIRIVCVHKCIQ